MDYTNPLVSSLQHLIFFVGEKPHCVWYQDDIESKTIEFLNNIDPTYFTYQANTHFKLFNYKKYRQKAALAIRTEYSHGLETLFSLLFAFLQAPYCIHAWLLLYKTIDIDELIRKINFQSRIKSLFRVRNISWKKLSELVFTNLILEDKVKEIQIKQGFGNLWSNLATDFVTEINRKEYNSIKHGFRIKPGGFHISIGAERTHGVPAPLERMHLLGNSEFGSSFIDYSEINGKKDISLKKSFINWNPEDMVWGLSLISMSIANIVSSLKIINGVDPKKVVFNWPPDLELLKEPWKRSKLIGVSGMTMSSRDIKEEEIKDYTVKELTDFYLQGKIN